MNTERQYSIFDRLCLSVDQAVRTLMDNTHTTGARYPAKNIEDTDLSDAERKHAAGLMRINHAGEVCAQALYHGQSVVAKNSLLKHKLQKAAIEEGDHLTWCKLRLEELGSHTSYLNPLWYAGSFCIGIAAGMIGDKWSLGFIVETEQQVIKHLAGHLERLPSQDQRSFKILEQMETEEAVHRDEAIASGAAELPWMVKKGMSMTSKIMVTIAYWI